MKAIILAAGMGARLKPLTEVIPKCLVEVGGKSLLEHSLEAIEENGIKDVTIVLGHLGEKIRSSVGGRFSSLNIGYIENEVYADSGSMYSLSLALKKSDDDVIFFDSDIIYDKKGLEAMLANESKSAILATNLSGSWDEVFVCGENGIVEEFRKRPQGNSTRIGEYVGLVKLSKESQAVLQETAAEYFRANGLKLEYEECISLCSPGVGIGCCYVDGLIWAEIDSMEDLKRVEREVLPRLVRED